MNQIKEKTHAAEHDAKARVQRDASRICEQMCKWGFPKIRGTILGVPIIRIIIFWGLYWGPPNSGNYQIRGRILATYDPMPLLDAKGMLL